MSLELVRVSLKEANAAIDGWHRHHDSNGDRLFQIPFGCAVNGKLVGVAILSNPMARALPQKELMEVTRCATDGTRNACSILYGACQRTAKNMGASGILTYTLASEDGASLRAMGWWPEVLELRSYNWHPTPSLFDVPTKVSAVQKVRWFYGFK